MLIGGVGTLPILVFLPALSALWFRVERASPKAVVVPAGSPANLMH